MVYFWRIGHDRLTELIDVLLLDGHPVLLLSLFQSLNNFGPTVVPHFRLGEGGEGRGGEGRRGERKGERGEGRREERGGKG